MSQIIRLLFFSLLLSLISACAEVQDPPKASISGTITPSQLSAVDSDVNNPLAPLSENDATSSAQLLPNPVILGGYLNRPGKGPIVKDSDGSVVVGRSHTQGDLKDIYKVNLRIGQSITVTVADSLDFNPSDLRLRLVDVDGDTINSSVSDGRTTDTLNITQNIPGDYFIEVAICIDAKTLGCAAVTTDDAGYSDYILSIGQNNSANNNLAYVDLNSDFVPGDLIVKFKQPSSPAVKAKSAVSANVSAMTLSDAATNLGMKVKSGAINRMSLFSLGDTAVSQRSALSSMGYGKQVDAVAFRENDPDRQRKLQTLQALQALRNNPDVELADVNFIRKATAVPNDAYYNLQWHYSLIGLPQAWEITTGTSTGAIPVIVAVVDTGVLVNHPDLQGQLVSGYDFIRDAGNAADGSSLDANGSSIDANPDDPGDSADPSVSSTFHGTHVSGTIAARTNNDRGDGSDSGVAGITWNAKIMPVRVLGRLGGKSYDVIQGVLYAAGLPNDSNTVPAQRADIINLSLGGTGSSRLEQNAFTAVRNAGVIVVAAAGNSNSDVPSYPASYSGVISVSAVDFNKRRAPYSNYGASVDIAAPGGNKNVDANGDGEPDGIYSTVGNDRGTGPIKFLYEFYQGTSMAAPHVAGVLALMKAVNPALTPGDIDSRITAGDITDNIGTTPNKPNSFGHGLINALKAVQSAAVGTAAPPLTSLLVATPTELNFRTTDSVLQFDLANAGQGALSAATPVLNTRDAWLKIIEDPAVSSGLGKFTVVVDRTGLRAGTYSTIITVGSDNNSVSILAVMKVVDTDSNFSGNSGYLYALLKNPENGQTIARTIPVYSNGLYQYKFDDVPSGDYKIIVGNDLDNNYIICQQSESCGSYSSLAQPLLISLDGDDKSSIDFSVSFIKPNKILPSLTSSTQSGFASPIN